MSNGSFHVPPAGPAAAPPAAPPRRRSAWSVVATVLLVLSMVANAVLFLAVLGMMALLSPTFTQGSLIEEEVIEKGPRSAKIAVIRVEGLLFEDMVEYVSPMLTRAAEDDNVKAVILRIDSPGGGLTASDGLHHAIQAFRDTGKPIVTAMDGVAASGGYYIACGTDYIVAQPTTLTGSIGVIAEFFFVNTLMQDKLGVTPVTLKMGDRKDWPNIFTAKDLAPEQREYLMESLLKPGYDRFVDIVAEGREMERDKVLSLATGGIFVADEALASGLVDEIGYLETAIGAAKELAKVTEARVVEYRRPPTLADLMGLGVKARQALDLRPERLATFATPRVMYLWKGF